MDPLIQTAIVGGAFLLAPLLFGRWKLRWAAALMAVFGTGVYAQRSGAADLSALVHSAALHPSICLVLWCIGLHAAHNLASRRPHLFGGWGGGESRSSTGVFSRIGLGGSVVLTTLVLGDLGSALIWGARLPEARQRARVALTASAAGMLSPLGTASSFLLEDRPWRIPLGLCLLALSWPRGTQAGQPTRNRGSLGGLLAWLFLLGVLCCAADWSGTHHLAQEGLVWLEERFPYHLAGIWTLVGVLFAALGGEEGAVIMASSVIGESQGAGVAYVNMALASGMAVGGIGPLIAVGGLRAGWKLWLVQVAVAVLITSVLCAWRFA